MELRIRYWSSDSCSSDLGGPLDADLSARYSPCRYILYRAKTRQCLIRIRAAAQRGYPSEPRCGATQSGASLAACLASPARATHAATSPGSAAQAQRGNRHRNADRHSQHVQGGRGYRRCERILDRTEKRGEREEG